MTQYVGNGAELEIKLTDHKGKSHGTFKDKLIANRLSASIQVPSDAKDALFADVKLPKHGLSQKSPALLLLPAVEIKNVKWDKEEARRGDILKLSADVEGVPDGMEAEITIWEHDADGAHDLVTKLPVLVDGGQVETEWEFEYLEDTDDIPTEEEAERGYAWPEYFFNVTIGGVTERSNILPFQDWVNIRLLDMDGQPIPNQEYLLILADGSERRGHLDDMGEARLDDLPPGGCRIVLPGHENAIRPLDSD